MTRSPEPLNEAVEAAKNELIVALQRAFHETRRKWVSAPQHADSIDAAIGYWLIDAEVRVLDAPVRAASSSLDREGLDVERLVRALHQQGVGCCEHPEDGPVLHMATHRDQAEGLVDTLALAASGGQTLSSEEEREAINLALDSNDLDPNPVGLADAIIESLKIANSAKRDAWRSRVAPGFGLVLQHVDPIYRDETAKQDEPPAKNVLPEALDHDDLSPGLSARLNAVNDAARRAEDCEERERDLRDDRVASARFHIAHNGAVRHPKTCADCRHLDEFRRDAGTSQ